MRVCLARGEKSCAKGRERVAIATASYEGYRVREMKHSPHNRRDFGAFFRKAFFPRLALLAGFTIVSHG